MKPLLALLCALALAGAPAIAAAQALRRDADPEAVMVEELVVKARAPGPAWWRVSKGDSAVWVFGVPAGLPKDVTWNDRLLRVRLAEAKGMILPAQVRVGPLKAVAFFLKNRKNLRSKTPLEPQLPPALARRFAAARQGMGYEAKRYQDWKPAIAGAILNSDFRRKARLEQDAPQDRIRALARKAGVRERRAATYPAGPILNALLAIPPDVQLDCLEDSIVEVEAGSGRMTSAAKGWAVGDVRAALTAERGYERCLAALPALSGLLQRGQADMAAAIASALDQKGDTVAVVELRQLLARGGVLDRLRAQGFKVETPGNDKGS